MEPRVYGKRPELMTSFRMTKKIYVRPWEFTEHRTLNSFKKFGCRLL